MKKNIQAVRGMNDYLPCEIAIWQHVEETLKRILHSYGYSEIRFPIVENTSLFKRAIGEITDVIEKEMYSFKDRKENSLTLRPEGTAGCVRASIEHSLLHNNQEQRLWYIGPMFRYERPQKGRYRQFNQLGVEVFGLQGPNIDAELIMIGARFWKSLNISKYVSLELNSIASSEARLQYQNALVFFLEKHKENLDEDCKRRMKKNPLRILDSKNPTMQALLRNSPKISEYLDDYSKKHFVGLCKILDKEGISYNVNQQLIRGLDYYSHTVFEWITNRLGSQRAICSGGRYNGLVEQLGGNSSPAVGFAIGLERLVLLIKTVNSEFKANSVIDVYLIATEVSVYHTAMHLAECIRDNLPDVKLMTNYKNGSIKKQIMRAYKLGAIIALLLKKSDILSGQIVVKNLLSGEEVTLMQKSVVSYLRNLMNSIKRNS